MHLTPWPPLLKERGKRGQGVKGVRCISNKRLFLRPKLILMPEEYVILVDEKDNEIGSMEKIEAHEKAVLHRAFSIFVFNNAGQMMLQRRALSKYHSPGLWTNTCCSHPRPGENLEEATPFAWGVGIVRYSYSIQL